MINQISLIKTKCSFNENTTKQKHTMYDETTVFNAQVQFITHMNELVQFNLGFQTF